VVSSLFPAFAMAKNNNPSRASELFSTGTRFILVVLAPIVLAIVTFAREGLEIWLGTDFGQHSTLVLQWLAVGVFLNSLGHSPFALIQGFGRPDLTAKLHIIELPVYVLLLIWLLRNFGINGVAIAWVCRVAMDTALLLFVAYRLLPVLAKPLMQTLPLVLVPLPLFLAGEMLHGLAVKTGFYFLATLIMALVAYFFACSRSERQMLKAGLWSMFEISVSR
jgi:O-antigen/teichoic acid export membrane protein